MISLLLGIPVAGWVAMAVIWGRPRGQAWCVFLCSVGHLGAGLFAVAHTGAPVDYAVGGWGAPIGIALRLDELSAIMIALSGFVTTAAALYHLGETYRGRKGTDNAIYHLTFLLLLFALTGVFLTHDLFNFYVFFELVAVSSYLIVASGKYHPLEAAWKYAIQSVLGSTALLVGIVLVYTLAGTLNMSDLAEARPGSLDIAAPFLLTSFLLKGSLFPFHLWQQDAHAAASSPGSAILAGLLIKVGLYGFFRIWPLLFGLTYQHWLMALGAVSIVFGAVAAWREPDAKRMLGFSSVSQMGFILLALGWGTPGAVAAALFFLLHHSVSKSLLFLCTGALSDARGTAKFAALRGSGRSLPWLQAGFLSGGFSLVGLPPTLGLVGKIGLLQEGLRSVNQETVALVLLGSLLTLGYVLRAHRLLFWEAPADGEVHEVRVPPAASAAIAVLSAAVLLGGPAGGPLWRLCAAGAAAGSHGVAAAGELSLREVTRQEEP